MMILTCSPTPRTLTVMAPASTYGYLAMADATTPDFYTTFVRDWAMYAPLEQVSKPTVAVLTPTSRTTTTLPCDSTTLLALT
ncbi:MAG: hypothetical protein CM15mP78_12850 [Candidatus Poseidoniales archaeon]|nr:MAG: hypothetical protein CM15mP78_12850 [Candidatus Poseidoniales archaeon]